MQEGFATCLAVRLEENGRLTLANAGHIPPYLNGLEVQFPGSLPLGLAESSVYDQTGFGTAVGDAIMMMTDGIAEARSEQGVLLGFVRVEAMLQTGASAASVAEAAQQHGQNDDITVLQVARLES
jgi:serine phosphatase RsbU (regulator of sigma subunit)